MSSNKDTNATPDDDNGNSKTSDSVGSDALQDHASESFAFALVNGALGVFEVYGRRIRDFRLPFKENIFIYSFFFHCSNMLIFIYFVRPKWPASPFISSDGLITAMAYRLPHVVCTYKRPLDCYYLWLFLKLYLKDY